MLKLRSNIIIDESHSHPNRNKLIAAYSLGFATATILIFFVEYLLKL